MKNLLCFNRNLTFRKSFLASLIIVLLSLLSCSSDEVQTNQNEDQPPEEFIEGGEVAKYQLVSLEIENITSESFEGTVNENTISIVKSGENLITLLIDDNFEIGENILDVPTLDNNIRFTVNNTVLSKPLDETLADLSTNFNNYAETLGNENNTAEQTYVINAIENYNSTIQQLSPEEKELVALTYQANKEFFDNLYQTDYTVPKAGRDFSKLTNTQLAVNFAGAAGGFASAGYLALVVPNPIVALPLVIVAITLWEIAGDLGDELISRTNVLYDQFQFDDFISNATTKNNSALEFISEVPRQITFKSKTRSINSSDADNQNTTISSIFFTTGEFNEIIGRLNDVITFVNAIPFTDIPLIDNFTIPSQSQTEDINVNQDIFANISFSIDNSNLNLTDVSFENDFLNMTISIIDDTDVEDFIEATINYDFQNDTNDLTGNFPVKVLKEGASTSAVNIEIVSGNNQTGNQGEQLNEPLVVVAKDSSGDLVSGQEVLFKITSGGGSLSQENIITDQNGNAKTNWILGGNQDLQTVEASIIDNEGNVIDSVSFSATVDATVDNPFIGNWQAVSFNGENLGQYQKWIFNNCDDFMRETRIFNGSIQITQNKITVNISGESKTYGYDEDLSCDSWHFKENINLNVSITNENIVNYVNNQTFEFNGNSFNNSASSSKVILINNNTFKLEEIHDRRFPDMTFQKIN